ncbi:MAG: DUF4361 domain-containing protein [Bacteroidales bacterium]|nr:DUF4361 domain-containing protein [Bacteroidales bacterium]
MNNILKYIALSLFVIGFYSCESNLMDEEHYKKVIYLKSSDNNIFTYSHPFNDSITTGYVTVGSGGSMPLDKDVTVSIDTNIMVLNEYNYRNFDLNYDKYARMLDKSRYSFPSKEIVIKAGNINAATFFPVEVDVNGLSPDSTYMIPLKINAISDYEVNPEKDFVLYTISLKNKYSEDGLNIYKMKGSKQPEGGNISAVTTTKKLLPLSSNKLRMFPENIINSTSLEDIEDKTFVVIVNDDNTLKLKSYKNLKIEQLENCYYDSELEIFNLNYKYRLPNNNVWIFVKEILTRVK